jgi:microcompartment protein CcmK/EutM
MASTDDQQLLQSLKSVVDSVDTGSDEVVLIIGGGETKQAIRLPQKVSSSDAMKKDLQALFGQDNVRIQ